MSQLQHNAILCQSTELLDAPYLSTALLTVVLDLSNQLHKCFFILEILIMVGLIIFSCLARPGHIIILAFSIDQKGNTMVTITASLLVQTCISSITSNIFQEIQFG